MEKILEKTTKKGWSKTTILLIIQNTSEVKHAKLILNRFYRLDLRYSSNVAIPPKKTEANAKRDIYNFWTEHGSV